MVACHRKTNGQALPPVEAHCAEALRRLRDEGVVVSRKGSGSFVAMAFAATAAPGARTVIGGAPPPMKSIADVQHFYTYRILLEGEIAAEAAATAGDAAVAEIDAAARSIEELMQQREGAVYRRTLNSTARLPVPPVIRISSRRWTRSSRQEVAAVDRIAVHGRIFREFGVWTALWSAARGRRDLPRRRSAA